MWTGLWEKPTFERRLCIWYCNGGIVMTVNLISVCLDLFLCKYTYSGVALSLLRPVKVKYVDQTSFYTKRRSTPDNFQPCDNILLG